MHHRSRHGRASEEIHPGESLTHEEADFGRAMERYQRVSGRRYPTWLEVLNVAKDTGYRKVTDASVDC